MKKMYAILAAMIAFSTVSTMTIFAEETQQKLPVVKELPEMKDVEQNNVTMQSQYMTISGIIKAIEKDEDRYTISVTQPDDEIGVVFITNQDNFIVDSKDGSFMTLEQLQNGMNITAIVAKNAPMTMSLPPATNPIGFIVGEQNFVTTGYFNEELTSEDAQTMLQLNISEETKIVDIAGSKKIFTQEDVKNQDCVVIYGATTRSIPAQTNPVFVMILDKQEIEEIEKDIIGVIAAKEYHKNENEQETVSTPPAQAITEPLPLPEQSFVPLREIAENEGFTVTWTANDKPVLLQKNGVTIEIMVGQKEYKKGEEVLQAEKAPELIKSKIYVSKNILL